eukprot:CAMPEP_0172574162 /NCGR_PEP_ID=MMETSP1067-20121228/136562_1 /TAXON_ID=265564 ORGANISM="Thalassiosira punctigera, Strain Tpunct2005C2" /NCGR_SAMPLE_ID=MMETSP1067 /ASSEMBLY_ACC=CAM_ASM_000444 /LENGTH=529 /DNA_ID=CAMNT_0013366785 /DNA_START=270 /DNA_END=1855 /DNA_ORIENTATION=+
MLGFLLCPCWHYQHASTSAVVDDCFKSIGPREVEPQEDDLGNVDCVHRSGSCHILPSTCSCSSSRHDAAAALVCDNSWHAQVLVREHSGDRELLVCDRSGNAEAVACDQSGHAEIVVRDHSGNAEVAACDQIASSDGDIVPAQVFRDVTSVVEATECPKPKATLPLGQPAPESVLTKLVSPAPSSETSLLPEVDEQENAALDHELESDSLCMRDSAETSLLPEVDEQENAALDHELESDSLCMLSIDFSELENVNHTVNFRPSNFVDIKDSNKEAADSALAWSALGILLGSPAPRSVPTKNIRLSRNATRNLWEEMGAMGNDELNTIPSIHLDDDDISSISSRPCEDDVNEHIIPDLDELSTANATKNSPHRSYDIDKKSAADSTIAWTALAALLGSPTPLSAVGKKSMRHKGSVTNLWDDGNAAEDDLDGLLMHVGSCEDVDEADQSSIMDSEVIDNDGSDTVQCIVLDEDCIGNIRSPLSEDQYDEISIPDLAELASVNSLNECQDTNGAAGKKEVADSAIAWTALA